MEHVKISKGLLATMVLLLFTLCGFAQDHVSAFEKAKEIQLLKDNRAAVRQKFSEYLLYPLPNSDAFSLGNIRIEVFYSSGTCSDEEEEVWDVADGLAVRVTIFGFDELRSSDLHIDISRLEREQIYDLVEDQFIYHDKKTGIAVEVVEDEVDNITLIPSIKTKAKLCKTKYAEEFVSMASWFGSKKLEDRACCIYLNKNADVNDVSLSHDVISALTPKHIKVFVTAVDPEGDVLTYNYTVTGGRIIGSGAKVVWDLAGVRPGTYTLTAAVDDGAGPIGKQVTKSVTVH
ncbi:MAG: hypothetical protein KF685_13120 [Acidobacteria bacterium]|nr:hypothetical protein [Acidobacteriota bacterium]